MTTTHTPRPDPISEEREELKAALKEFCDEHDLVFALDEFMDVLDDQIDWSYTDG